MTTTSALRQSRTLAEADELAGSGRSFIFELDGHLVAAPEL